MSNSRRPTASLLLASPDQPLQPSPRKLEIQSLQLADTEKAEKLSGYISGAIPPLGHVNPMLLIVDQTLAQQQILSVGSESFQHSLHLSSSNLIDFAKRLCTGVFLAPISAEKSPATASKEPLKSVLENESTTLSLDLSNGQEEIFMLGKLLREACLQKGKMDSIQSVLSQVGDRFPEASNDICFEDRGQTELAPLTFVLV